MVLLKQGIYRVPPSPHIKANAHEEAVILKMKAPSGENALPSSAGFGSEMFAVPAQVREKKAALQEVIELQRAFVRPMLSEYSSLPAAP